MEECVLIFGGFLVRARPLDEDLRAPDVEVVCDARRAFDHLACPLWLQSIHVGLPGVRILDGVAYPSCILDMAILDKSLLIGDVGGEALQAWPDDMVTGKAHRLPALPFNLDADPAAKRTNRRRDLLPVLAGCVPCGP